MAKTLEVINQKIEQYETDYKSSLIRFFIIAYTITSVLFILLSSYILLQFINLFSTLYCIVLILPLLLITLTPTSSNLHLRLNKTLIEQIHQIEYERLILTDPEFARIVSEEKENL